MYSMRSRLKLKLDACLALCFLPPLDMSTTEAGPSSAGPSTSSSAAPEHRLPTTHFYSVEFPGNVKEDSIPRAIHHLGGQARLNRAFKRNASKFDSLLELNWRPENPFSHPVPGPVVNTDSILVKVTKKRRKRKDGSESEFQGEMVVEAVGVVPKTVRFRSKLIFLAHLMPGDLPKFRYG